MTSRNVPRLRFKGFGDEWNKEKLGNVSTIQRGASPRPITNPKWFDDDSNIGWIRISDVTEQNGKIRHLSQHISELGQKKTRVLKEPHLLLSIAASVGKPVINYVPTGVHDGFLIFKNIKFDMYFMFYFLEYFQEYWQKYGQPGSQVNLNASIVRQQFVGFPSLIEQKHIGNFFSKLDYLIDLHSQKLEQLKKLKHGYLQKMFPQKGETVPRLRFSGFSGEWTEVELGKIGKTFNGLSGKNKKDFGHGKGLYVNYLSINKKDFVDISNTDKVDVNENEKQNTLEKGDVLFTTSSETPDEVGLSSVWNSDSKAFLNSFSFVFRMNKKFDLYFSGYMFRSLAFRKEIYPLAQGISRYNLSKTNFLKLTIKFPSMEEQEKIGKYLHSLDLLIDKENSRVNELKKQKKAYLQKMFI